MGKGGNITATDRLRNVIRKKVKKYRAVTHRKEPLIVFLYEGDLLHISRESIEWALLGKLQGTFAPGQDEVLPSLASGGLFMPGPDGYPRNTLLSAVVYCRRRWENGMPHAAFLVYHHPAAANPIPLTQFEPYPQCEIKIGKIEVRQKWTTDPEANIPLLPMI
jgi:hypothetical protein